MAFCSLSTPEFFHSHQGVSSGVQSAAVFDRSTNMAMAMTKCGAGRVGLTHLLVLLLTVGGCLAASVIPVDSDESLAGTFSLPRLTADADTVDCKDAAVRFDEPCRCYRKNATSLAGIILDCDELAFQFFPPIPSNSSILMASFRNIGYQGLPTELFRGRSSDLRALDLSNNHLLSITTSSLSGLENSLEWLNLSSNSLGRNFQPLLDIPELHRLKALKVLDLSRNGIKLISEQFFSGLTSTLEEIFLLNNDLTDVQFLSSVQNLLQLRILNLAGNRIFRLESQGFATLPALSQLDLQDNFLSMMLPGSLNGTQIKTLNLRRNRIQAIDDVVFSGLENSLKDLDMSFNVLQKLPDLRTFNTLERVNFSSNVISNFNDDISLPISTKTLDLSGNHLTARSIPYLTALPALQRLDVSRNFLGNFFNALPWNFIYSQLEQLSLRSTNLTRIPTPLFPFLPRLRDLDLSYNSFSMLSGKSFLNASLLLQRVSLSHCRIKSVSPDAFFPMPNLQVLDVSSNFLSNVTDLAGLPRGLMEVNIAKNKLAQLPDFQFSVPNLITLDASGNMLTKVDLNILPNRNLRRLDLSGNLLTAIPAYCDNNSSSERHDFLGSMGWMISAGEGRNDRINRTSVIEVLDLSWNRIVDVKPVWGLPNLTEINLSGNKITALPAGFLNALDDLSSVNLSRNLIASMENSTFSSLSSLKIVDLSYNRLKSFTPDSFSQIPALKHLSLNANGLSGFSTSEPFSQFPSLEDLNLSKNSLTKIHLSLFYGASLRQLDLSGNRLTKLFNTSFGLQPRLRSLSLQGNSLSEISSATFWFVPQLQVLDLSRNLIRALPEDVFRGIRRLSLNLANNKLENLPFEIFIKSRIDRLEELNLGGNQFLNFPDKTLAEQDYNLITLNLAKNQIMEIPQGSLISTKNVDLSSNPLSEQAIQIVLSDPKTTFNLNLAKVGMVNFPSLQLQFLTSLNMSGNKLVTFGDPLNWQRSTLLETIDLSDNQLTDLRDSRLLWALPKLAFLKWLDFSGNQLKVIRENELSGLINVDYLDVTDLPNLETFDISNFLEFPRLRTLKAGNYPRLANFPIGDISAQLPALRHIALELKYPILTSQLQGLLTPSIKSLSLTGPIVRRITRDTFGAFNPGEDFRLEINNLAVNSLPADIFHRFPRATHLDLDVKNTSLTGMDIAGLVQNLDFLDGVQYSFAGNQLECTCNSSGILSIWMLIRQTIRDVQCDTPSEMKGQNVLELDMTDLPCLPTAYDGSGAIPALPTRKASLLRPPPFSRFSEPTQDDDQSNRPTEPDVIFEMTTTNTASLQASTSQPNISHIEGAVAGIVVGLLLLTGLMIAAIVFWFRRERNRQSQLKTVPRNYIPPDAPYAIIPNTDVVPHPTWYPSPQPVLILPGRNTPNSASMKSGRFIPPDYPQFDHGGYFERGLYDVPFPDARSENVSRVMDGEFSDYARTSYAGKSIMADEDKDTRSERSFTAESCDMTFTFESVFSPPSLHNGDDQKSQHESIVTVEKP